MDRIIEIGAVRVRLTADGAEPGERFSTLVDPGRDIGSAITRLTGIRDADLVDTRRDELELLLVAGVEQRHFSQAIDARILRHYG